MGDLVTVKITGVEELGERMREFPDKLLVKGVRNALRAGGELLRLALSAAAPRAEDVTHGHEPGFLADHIAAKATVSTKNDKGSVKVGPVAKAFWGMFPEFGTRHQPAKPWMRPTFEANAQKALDAFVDSLKETFKEVANG